ncbi:MAG: YlxR family protein [Cystobacterineae bacterium]|nr:YlxR family protein [Cystobacterineae bacterium]
MSDAPCIQEKPKRLPRRTCVGCRKRKPKWKLLRCVIGEGDVFCWDKAQTLPGRGAYVCGNACLKKALAAKAFQRAFRGRQVKLGEEAEGSG